MDAKEGYTNYRYWIYSIFMNLVITGVLMDQGVYMSVVKTERR